MRLKCELEGFKECYVELAERWTWGEIVRLLSGALTQTNADLLREKTIKIHLVTVDGLEINDTDDLTNENIERLDFELYLWVATAYQHAVNELQELAKKNVRTSLGIKEARP